MIVIAKDSEDRLFQELRKCRDERAAQRCFYMAFSRSGLSKKKLFEVFLRLLNEVPNSYMAQVYICRDHDVFILMQGFMQRQFSDFLDKLSSALDAEDLARLGFVYEIGVHWSKLETLCMGKIAALEQARSQEHEETAQAAVLDKLSGVDCSRISNLSERRTQRERPLVMIADDDQLARTLAGNVLRQEYDVAFAKDGASAITEFVNGAPDVLFLDIGFPDISGHEVLEIVFQIDPEAYVIMFSGRKDEANIMKAIKAGAQGFLGKPFTREKLYQHVEKSPFVRAAKTGKGHYSKASQ